MTKLTKLLSVICVLLIVAVGLLGYATYKYSVGEDINILGGAPSPYNSTTTPAIGWRTNVIKSAGGTLGSVIITGAGANVFTLYDATTTNISKRAASMSTSTIAIVSFPASVAAGTYTFDAAFDYGLLINVKTTGTGTSTITWD